MRSARTTFLLMLAVGALPLLVAACGSSSSASTSASSSTSTAPDIRTAAGRAQLAACLKKQGVTLPQRAQGGPPPGGTAGGGGGVFGGGGGNGNGPPQGNSKFGNALRKCGVSRSRGGFRGQANSAQFKQAVTKFVACMKTNGYALPKPNTSGNGPVFDASKVNRNDPKFESAAQKCQGLLRPATQQGGGNAPPPGATTTTQ
jgi:hypothetical protein